MRSSVNSDVEMATHATDCPRGSCALAATIWAEGVSWILRLLMLPTVAAGLGSRGRASDGTA